MADKKDDESAEMSTESGRSSGVPLEEVSLDSNSEKFYRNNTTSSSPVPSRKPSKVTETCTIRDTEVSLKDHPSGSLMFLVFSSVALAAINVFLLSVSTSVPPQQHILPNGDRMVPCSNNAENPVCFEVVDFHGLPVYRSDGKKRFLNMRPCPRSARNTEHLECSGEFLFAHNSSVYWFQRLYRDIRDNTYSLVGGATSEHGDMEGSLRVRHMLTSPYNWILGYEEVPPNEHPDTSLYVRGTISTERCIDDNQN